MTTRLPVAVLEALPGDLSADDKIYVKPVSRAPSTSGDATPDHARLAGSGPPCHDLEILVRCDDRITSCLSTPDVVDHWRQGLTDGHAVRLVRQLDRALKQPAPFAGLDLGQPQIVGVINVTPDSFSDGGDAFDAADAVSRGRRQMEEGAAILDIGGESTRPGSEPVGLDEEIRRIEPVMRGLAGEGALISADTRKAEVMAAALDAGAAIVNDVSALTFDPRALDMVAARAAPVVLMHAQGDPLIMQAAPVYDHVSLDVYDYLEGRIEVCLEHGVVRENICVDPGIGFGKTLEHNLTLLRDLPLFLGLGCPVMLGASRKSLIARIAGEADPKKRLPGSLALALAGLRAGVQVLRVHDVAETRQAVEVWQAVEGTGRG